MHISQPQLQFDAETATLSAAVVCDTPGLNLPETLWLRFPAAVAPYLAPRADAFLVALLLPAMLLGEGLTVEGEVSPRLLRGVDDFQHLFSAWRPGVLQRVPISAPRRSVPQAASHGRSAAATFSGGLDSFYSIWRHQPPQCSAPERQVRHALVMTGIPGIRVHQAEAVSGWIDSQRALLAGLGVQLLRIDSNWEQFQPRGLENQMSYAMPLIAAAHALAPLLHTFYLPGALNYDNLHPDGSTPYSDPLLNSEILEIYPHGSAVGRMDKLRAMQDWPPLHGNLLVCFDSTRPDFAANCGVCSKCLRTRMMIEMLGKTGTFRTFPAALQPRDILLWGRWLEIGFRWETEVLRHCLRQRRDLLPLVLVSLALGYARRWLKRVLPRGLKRRIYRRTSPAYYRRYLD
ncbi:MAG: hypothetical protein HPY85_17140 [Anaerolineae bacterium]|nr:hypothetical protein [Anaerolineae bacterium]